MTKNTKRSFSILIMILCFNYPIKLIAQSTSPAPYCDASFDDMQGFPVDDHINSVNFGTLSNISNAQYAAPHYVNYTNLSPASFIAGNTYNLAINFYVAGGCGYGVWIDYNHNNAFESNEKVAGTTGNNYLTLGTANITQSVSIPTNALNGNTRMRVRLVEDDNHHLTSTDELPCNASTSATDVMDWGETEDYTIQIQNTTSAGTVLQNDQIAYPNPASAELYLINAVGKNYSVQSINGQTLLQGTIGDAPINISTLAAGTYFLFINDAKGLVTRQLLVKQ